MADETRETKVPGADGQPQSQQQQQQQQQAGGEIGEEIAPSIGIWGACAIGIGTMIAAGIFILSGLAVANVGTVALLSFYLAAVVAGLTAATYSEFASVYQESGGGYMYVANTFKSADWTYIMGWTMILGYPASAAFYLASFSDWFYRFIYPVFGIPPSIPYWVPALIILALLVFLNVWGTEESSVFQIVVTSTKLALLALFLYGGLQAWDMGVLAQSFNENIGHIQDIGLTSALVFITFFGYTAIATSAEEVKDPGNTIPKSIYISMGVTTAVYTLVVLVVVFAINDPQFLTFLRDNVDLGGVTSTQFVAQNGEVSMGRAAQYYLGPVGFYVIIVGALFSMLSAGNATILAGSRVKMAMARRGHLPASFEELHPSRGTPYRSVLFTGFLILTYLLLFFAIFGETPGEAGGQLPFGLELGIEGLTQFANCLLILGLAVVNVALIVSRRRHPDLERGFKVPLVPYLPIIAIISNLALVINVGTQALVLALIAELIGGVFWFTWMRRTPSVEEMEAATPTAVAEYTAEVSEREYEIVVPLANPEDIEQKMRMATRLARQHEGEILVVSVVTVPRQTPLHAGRGTAQERRALLRRAKEQVEAAGVPANGVIRIGHDAGDAIINTVRQHGSQAVLMGWRGRPARRSDVVLHTVVDRVVAEAPCDVFVEKTGTAASQETPHAILVPVGGGPHNELAIETAGAIARETGAPVRVVRIVKPDAPEQEREEHADALDEQAAEVGEIEGIEVETELVEGTDVASSIVREAEDCGLVIIGATREGLLQRFVFGALPETVSARLDRQTVLMVKRRVRATNRLWQSIRRLIGG